MATILIDFDGTCIPTLPMGGMTEYETGAEKVLKKLVKSGHDLVLWTARNNSSRNPYNVISNQFFGMTSLEEAVKWFKDRDIPLFGVNEVPGEIDKVGVGRKALGDYLIDDTAICTPIKFVTIKVYSVITERTEDFKSFHVDWDLLDLYLKTLGLIEDED